MSLFNPDTPLGKVGSVYECNCEWKAAKSSLRPAVTRITSWVLPLVANTASESYSNMLLSCFFSLTEPWSKCRIPSFFFFLINFLTPDLEKSDYMGNNVEVLLFLCVNFLEALRLLNWLRSKIVKSTKCSHLYGLSVKVIGRVWQEGLTCH